MAPSHGAGARSSHNAARIEKRDVFFFPFSFFVCCVRGGQTKKNVRSPNSLDFDFFDMVIYCPIGGSFFFLFNSFWLFGAELRDKRLWLVDGGYRPRFVRTALGMRRLYPAGLSDAAHTSRYMGTWSFIFRCHSLSVFPSLVSDFVIHRAIR